MKNDSLSRWLEEELKDPVFRKEYEKTEAQYQLTRAIIRERIKQDLTQKQLAERAKTTQAIISRVERMSFNPSLELMNRISTALGKKLVVRFK